MPIYHIKKRFRQKILYFGHSVDNRHNKIEIRVHDHIYGHKSDFSGPIPKTFIMGCSADDYLSDMSLFE